jgi:hypothetical protein
MCKSVEATSAEGHSAIEPIDAAAVETKRAAIVAAIKVARQAEAQAPAEKAAAEQGAPKKQTKKDLELAMFADATGLSSGAHKADEIKVDAKDYVKDTDRQGNYGAKKFIKP